MRDIGKDEITGFKKHIKFQFEMQLDTEFVMYVILYYVVYAFGPVMVGTRQYTSASKYFFLSKKTEKKRKATNNNNDAQLRCI